MAGESDQAGVYHSNYDSFDHYVRFGDPGFVYGIAEAQTVGHTVLRVADADVLPMQFGSFADTVDGYLTELHELADHKRKAAEELGKLLDQHAFTLASDPTRPCSHRSVSLRCRTSISWPSTTQWSAEEKRKGVRRTVCRAAGRHRAAEL